MENVEVFAVEGVKALTRMLRRRSAEVWLPPPRVLRSILGAQPHGGPAKPSCGSHHPTPSCRDPGHGPLIPQQGIEATPAPAPCSQGGLDPGRMVPGGQRGGGWPGGTQAVTPSQVAVSAQHWPSANRIGSFRAQRRLCL